MRAYGLYIIKNGIVIPEPDLLAWGAWYGDSHERFIANTIIGDTEISTVFLGIDRGIGSGAPVLFETMIFGGMQDGYRERYQTIEEARQGHERAVGLAVGDDNG